MLSIYVLSFIAVAQTGVFALSTEDIKGFREAVESHMVACAKEFSITEVAVEDAKKNENIDGLDPCFLSCMFKAFGTMNSDGKIDPETTIEKSKKYLSDENDRKKVEGIVKTCTKVNDEDVGDDAKGCKRAKLLLMCIIENKGDFALPK